MDDMAARNMACATNPGEAAIFAARLRTIALEEKEEMLLESAGSDYGTLVRLLLDDGVSPSAGRQAGVKQPLHRAAEEGAMHAMRALLRAGASLFAVDEHLRTPLCSAAAFDHLEATELLIDAGSPLEVPSDQRRLSPLLCAAANGHARVIQLLVRRGANMEAEVTAYGSLETARKRPGRALHYLCAGVRMGLGPQYTSALKALLELGADGMAPDPGLNTLSGAVTGSWPLYAATSRDNGNAMLVSILLPYTDIWRLHPITGNCALHSSILQGQYACFQVLLPAYSDNVDVGTIASGHPACCSVTGQTALKFAAESGDCRMVKDLLSAGANRLAVNSLKRLPLHSAAQSGHLGCLKLLIGKPSKYLMSRAEIDSLDINGMTPLQDAAVRGHYACCAALIVAGANADQAAVRAKVLHPDKPELIALLEGRLLPNVCDGCGLPAHRLRTCLGCQAVQYCSEACQLTEWRAHKADCKATIAKNEEEARSRFIKLETL